MTALEIFGIIIYPALILALSWGAYYLTRPKHRAPAE